MGVDWLYRASKSFNRALDKREVELRTRTLLTSEIQLARRTICGEAVGDVVFKEGDQLILQVVDNRLIAQRDNYIVAEFQSPRVEDIERIRGCCAELGEVVAVNALSCTVEVSVGHE
jgi:hypothetical protein